VKILFFVTLLSLWGCSSSPFTSPPDREDILDLKKNLISDKQEFIQPIKASNERQAEEFLRANLFLKEKKLHHSCKRFEYLASDTSFPLRQLAWVRSLGACEYPLIRYRKIWDLKKNDLPSWLQEEFVSTSLEVARRLKEKKYEAIFLSKSSRYKKIKKEKLKIVLESLSIAKNSDDEELVDEVTEKLHKLAPRLKKNISSAERFKVGRDYENIRQFDKARVYYRKIIRDPNSNINTKKLAWNRLRLSYKLERQKPTYVHKTKKMVDFFKAKLKRYPKSGRIKRIWVDTSIKYSRALWTQHKREAGRKVLLGLLSYGVNSPNFLTEIHWILGKMKAEEKKFLEAIEQYKIASELPSTNKSLKEKIQWALGWNYFLLGKYEETIEHFKKFYENNESHGFNLKLRFWTAKSYMELGKSIPAKKIYRELTREDPYGYYGIISHVELDKSFSPIDVDERSDYHEDNTLEWLLALEEKELAQTYLKSIQNNFKSTEQILSLLPLYEKVGWYEGGIFKFFKIPVKDRLSAQEEHLTSAFPIPNKEIVLEIAKKYKVPPGLIFSITRQESAFNPVIRSWADAFGLMQLIPERAKELASRHQIPYKVLEDLYDPYINISLGAALLGELKRKFNNNFIQYVASYNASESVVKKWFATKWDGDPIKFIENIPYEETQGYVKLVLRNMITYRRLIFDESFKLKKEMLTNL
tara:strand:+ start:148792 stop:150888 length:2097 start_codon:yes stop_codon:yes gene_type:complete